MPEIRFCRKPCATSPPTSVFGATCSAAAASVSTRRNGAGSWGRCALRWRCRGSAGVQVRRPAQRTDRPAGVLRAIADRLAQGIAGFEELLALPGLRRGSGRFAGGVPGPADPFPAGLAGHRVAVGGSGALRSGSTAWLWRRPGRAGCIISLASPVAGTGVRVDDFGLLTTSAAVFDGKAEAPAVAAQHGLSIITALGRRLMDQGKTIDNDGEAIEFLAKRMAPVIEDHLPCGKASAWCEARRARSC